ncbi:TPA: S-(hydroxymethyl)glutathione dehydrogenase [Escherichia coli]
MLSFQVFLFKKALEEELYIIKWHPTNEQLEEMFNEIKKLSGNESITEVENIVHRIYKKPITRMICNGLNTSKASSLLAKIQSQSNNTQQKR